MRPTVSVKFTGGPLKGKTMEVLESTARRGVLRLVHQSYWKDSESRYRLRFSEANGWVARRM